MVKLVDTLDLDPSAARREGRCEDSLKAHRKQAQMPGFRKGKIPLGLIRKQYGKSVLADELNKLLVEALQKYCVEENKLDVLGKSYPV